LKEKRSSVSDSDAVFIGWQETPSGDILALYTITAVHHPSYNSTVSENTLKKMKLKIPKQHRSIKHG
jgi:hypothetical protein